MILERDDFGQVHGTFRKKEGESFVQTVDFFHGKIDKIYDDDGLPISLGYLKNGKPCGCCQGLITFEKNHGLYFCEAIGGFPHLTLCKPDKNREHLTYDLDGKKKYLKENALKLFTDYIVKQIEKSKSEWVKEN